MNCWIINVGEPIPQLDGNGRAFRCALVTNALVEAGHSVVRWSSTFRHITKDFRRKEYFSLDLSEQLSCRFLHGLGYIRHRSPRRLLHHHREATNFRAAARREARPDVIFVSIPTLNLAREAIDYGMSMDVPVVVDVRDCWPDHYLTILPPALRPVARPLLFRQYQQLRKVLSHAAGVTAVSQTFLDWAKKRGAERVPRTRVIPIGYEWPSNISRNEFPKPLSDAGISSTDFVVLFVGTFTASYDFSTIISAARALAAENITSIKFVLVGSGPQAPLLERAQQLLPNVRLLGWIDRPEVLAQILEKASVGLCPYRHDCTMTLPNKPFEYMAAGKPLVSSLRGEFRAILENEKIGIQYHSSDAGALAGAIRKLHDDREAAASMGRRARELFDAKYTPERIYPELVNLLESVAGKTALPKEQLHAR